MRVITPAYKTFLVMAGTITGGVIAGEKVHIASLHDPMNVVHPLEHGALNEKLDDPSLARRRTMYQWAMDYRFGILGAVWATSVGVSFANQMRQPYFFFSL